jgi:hypothetical protein
MPCSPPQLLDFLFSTIARKLPPIRLREGAAIARYLHSLAWDSARGPERKLLDALSHGVWGIVLQRADFETADRRQVVEFLEKNAHSHLVQFDVVSAVKLIRSLPGPKPHSIPPVLSGPFHSETLGSHRSRLKDDLTERIAAAYWDLRYAKVPKASTLIAGALNRYGISTRSRESDSRWCGYEVMERVKQYDQVLAKQNADRLLGRRRLVDKWNALNRSVKVPIP